MKKLISVQIIAAASVIAFFPLAATANSFAQERAFEYLSQPLNTSSIETDYIDASSTNVSGGQSHAAANALKHAQGNKGSQANLQEISKDERNTARNTLNPLEPGYVWWQ